MSASMNTRQPRRVCDDTRRRRSRKSPCSSESVGSSKRLKSERQARALTLGRRGGCPDGSTCQVRDKSRPRPNSAQSSSSTPPRCRPADHRCRPTECPAVRPRRCHRRFRRSHRRAHRGELFPRNFRLRHPPLLGWAPKAWRLSSALNLRAATRASYRMLIRISSARSERTLQHAMRRASSIRSSTRSPGLARGVSHTWAARMHMTEPARWDPRAAAAQVAMEMESRAAATRAQVAMQQSQQYSARRMRRGASSSRH